MKRAWIMVVLGTGCLAAAGCVERRISITSEPSGARVVLNDRDVGATPLEVDFTWFGVYDVRVTKAGYEPLITSREAKAPLHETPPIDFFALLVPGTKTTHIDWHFELEPANNDPGALLERADALRHRMREEEAAAGASGAAGTASAAPEDVEPARASPAGDYVEEAVDTPAPAVELSPAPAPPPAPTPTAPTGKPDYEEVTPR